MEEYAIKDLERLSGIKAHTIRIWERRYGLIDPQRTTTNRRRYSGYDLRRIINIAILKRNGLKISAIARLTDAEMEEKISFILADSGNLSVETDALVVAMLATDTSAIDKILVKAIMSKGFAETVTGVIFPFLNRLGVMWQTGAVDPGYEHYMTNIFRNRLITAIEALPAPGNSKKSKKVLLFLPEGELHELALLFSCYVIKRAGHEVLYLGQVTPLSSAVIIANQWNADIIITGNAVSMKIKGDDYLKNLSESFSGRRVMVSGLLTDTPAPEGLTNLVSFSSAEELLTSMSSS